MMFRYIYIDKIQKIKTTYKILLIFVLINILYFFIIGGYLEEYEGLLSSISSGQYTYKPTNEWLHDSHFILFPIYSFLDSMLSFYSFYSLFLYILNLVTLYLVFYSTYKYFVKQGHLGHFGFLIIFLFVSTDLMINIGSSKIMFILSFIILVDLVFDESNNLKSTTLVNFTLILGLFFISLIRSQIVLISFFIAIVSKALIDKKIPKLLLWFSLIPILIFLIHQILSLNFLSEARLSFLFYEMEFFDKSNIDYEKLNFQELIDVNAFKLYNIVDNVHFTYDFYRNISHDDILFRFSAFFKSFKNILYVYKISYPYTILSTLFLITILFTKKISANLKLSFLFIYLFIIFLLLIINVPQRFVIVYHSLSSILFLYVLLIKCPKNKNVYIIVLFVSIFFIYVEIPRKIQAYKKTQHNVNTFMDDFNKINTINDLIVINNVEYMGRYFAVDPFFKYNKNANLTFLNFWYFTTYNCYIEFWNDFCQCNPLSLAEKVTFLVENDVKFITSDNDFRNLANYMRIKYKKNIKYKNKVTFDETLYSCNLYYN